MQRQSQIRLCYCTTITGYMFKSGFLETWLISNPWPVTYDAYGLLICVINPNDNEAICTHNLIRNFQPTIRDGNLHATSFKKTEANPLHQDCLSIATGQGFQYKSMIHIPGKPRNRMAVLEYMMLLTQKYPSGDSKIAKPHTCTANPTCLAPSTTPIAHTVRTTYTHVHFFCNSKKLKNVLKTTFCQ